MNSMKAYLQYGEERTSELDIWRKRYKKLPRSQRSVWQYQSLKNPPHQSNRTSHQLTTTTSQTLERTTNYTDKLNSVEDLMLRNAALAQDILTHNLQYYGISRPELEAFVQATTSNSTNHLKGTISYAMKHFVRDWSTDGLPERVATYPCVLRALTKAFPASARTTTTPIQVLVPGSALGRLGHEIASLGGGGGFAVTLNEMSPSMNMAYHYLTTLTAPENAATIYPYVDWWSHRATTAHLKRAVKFPDDIDTLTLPRQAAGSVSLIEGDFTTALTSHSGTYDVVVTHFFLDTAPNILTYLETLHSLLKPGGVWVNFGPLLYGSAPAVQLSMDEVIAVAEDLGFEIEEVENGDGDGDGICGRPMEFDGRVRGKEVPYASDVESLARNTYLAQFWVARKKEA
jgi:SAM-dependent methyltransferase